MSYRGKILVNDSGFEPLTFCVSSRCTTTVLIVLVGMLLVLLYSACKGESGAPEETRTPKIWFLRPTRIPNSVTGAVLVEAVGFEPTDPSLSR